MLSLYHMLDNAVVIMELNPEFHVVTESARVVDYCLTVIIPGPEDELPFEFFVDLETVDGTASTACHE